MIYRSSEALKAKAGDFFDYMERQIGGECYIAAEELPSFCRDLLPLLRETFRVTAEGFDETLYVPKKPEFELYLDKQDNQTVGAKLVAAYGDDKYNVLQKIEPGEVRDLGEEMRVRTLVEPYFNEYGSGRRYSSSRTMRTCSISSSAVVCSASASICRSTRRRISGE